MKAGAKYIVMRRAPMIGRPASPRRTSVCGWAYTLADALAQARSYAAMYRTYGIETSYWITAPKQPAHRKAR